MNIAYLEASNKQLLASLKAIVEWEMSEDSGIANPTVEQADRYMRIIGMAVKAIAAAEKENQ